MVKRLQKKESSKRPTRRSRRNRTAEEEKNGIVEVEPTTTHDIVDTRRAALLDVANRRAAFFARGEEEEKDSIDNDNSLDQNEEESWPGPYTTARDLHNKRSQAKLKRETEIELKKQQSIEKKWIPKRLNPRVIVKSDRTIIPKLSDIVLNFVASNIECVPTLEYIDTETRLKMLHLLCKQRKLTKDVIHLLMNTGMRDFHVPDCSLLNDQTLIQSIERCYKATNPSMLESIYLNYCGICISDHVINELAIPLNQVTKIRFGGCYRLTDKGMKSLTHLTPNLTTFELSSNLLLTEYGISTIPNWSNLQHLCLEDFPQLTPAMLKPLHKLKTLKKLHLCQLNLLNDDFLIDYSNNLQFLEDLSLKRCHQITDLGIQSILLKASNLSVLNLSDVIKITNQTLFMIADQCLPISHLYLQRCSNITDDGIVQLSKGTSITLQTLALNSLPHLTDLTINAISEGFHKYLKEFDLSFCRGISDDGLGQMVEICHELRTLTLWGCTQISSHFLQWHSNDELIIIGHPLLTGLSLRY